MSSSHSEPDESDSNSKPPCAAPLVDTQGSQDDEVTDQCAVAVQNESSARTTASATSSKKKKTDGHQNDPFSSNAAQKISGGDIAALLRSKGPVVKAVLLRHLRPDGKDVKPHHHVDSEKIKQILHQKNESEQEDSKPPAYIEKNDKQAASDEQEPEQKELPVLDELIEEIEIDTTPSRSHVREILGGAFTFLGQWPSEGTVAMVRKDCLFEFPDNYKLVPIKTLRRHCQELDIDTSSTIEKSELIDALEERRNNAMPQNPHRLQPPLHNIKVRGDILVMKVAETKEELDEEDEEQQSEYDILSNEEFFLNYTKEEYVHFASRTDIVEEVNESDDQEEEEDEEVAFDEDYEDEEEQTEEIGENLGEEEDDEDEDYELDDDDLDKHSLLNIILGGVIQKFRADNGRGPNTEEVLELRRAVAAELEVEVPEIPNDTGDSAEARGQKRANEGDTADADDRQSKRVKFAVGSESQSDEAENGIDDAKEEAQDTGKNQSSTADSSADND